MDWLIVNPFSSLGYSEIFGLYTDFCCIAAKGAIVNVVNSEVSGSNVTKILHNVEKFIAVNVSKSELQYCNLFLNGSATK